MKLREASFKSLNLYLIRRNHMETSCEATIQVKFTIVIREIEIEM